MFVTSFASQTWDVYAKMQKSQLTNTALDLFDSLLQTQQSSWNICLDYSGKSESDRKAPETRTGVEGITPLRKYGGTICSTGKGVKYRPM